MERKKPVQRLKLLKMEWGDAAGGEMRGLQDEPGGSGVGVGRGVGEEELQGGMRE